MDERSDDLLRRAYDVAGFRESGKAAVDLLGDYLDGVMGGMRMRLIIRGGRSRGKSGRLKRKMKR